MSKGLFITATATDAGKTYITALIIKKLREIGINAGYYKAALSGAESVAESDAGYVNKIAGIGESEEILLSYLYKNAVSPHLASKIEGNPVELEVVKSAFEKVKNTYDYVTVEGSGGIVCPIRIDENHEIYLEDIIKLLNLPAVIIADAGLGTINAVVLTVNYMRDKGIVPKGIILNHYIKGDIMQEDNIKMIEKITGLKVVAKVRDNDINLDIAPEILKSLYKEI